MEDNIVKSSDVNPKEEKTDQPVKKSPAKPKKVVSERNPNEEVASAPDGHKFVYYASGAGYVTSSGFRFSEDKRIHLLKNEEADHLLQFPNFRLPDQLELIEYSKEI